MRALASAPRNYERLLPPAQAGEWEALAYEALGPLLPGDPAASLRLALAHAGAGRLDVAVRVLDRELVLTVVHGRLVRAAVDERGRAVLGLSGGLTPIPMFAELAAMDLPWDRIEVVQVDERVAPDGDPESAANAELIRVNPDLRKIFIVTEKLSVHDSREIRAMGQQNGVDIFGANSLGVADAWQRVRIGERITVDLHHLGDRHGVFCRIEVRSVGKQETQRVADAAVALDDALQDLVGDRQLARVVGGCRPEPQDFRAERLQPVVESLLSILNQKPKADPKLLAEMVADRMRSTCASMLAASSAWPRATQTSWACFAPRRTTSAGGSARAWRSRSSGGATPMSARNSRTFAISASGAVDPHLSLMLRPLGSTPILMTSAPNSQSASGATL